MRDIDNFNRISYNHQVTDVCIDTCISQRLLPTSVI